MMALTLILFITAGLQFKYLNLHISRQTLGKSRHKQRMLCTTFVFSISMMYRAIFSILKLIYSAQVSPTEPNPIEDLERYVSIMKF
jgi:hypothetical protein